MPEVDPRTQLHLAGPFRRFSTRVRQNAHINNVRRAIVCDLYFPFLKFYNFIKRTMCIYIAFLKNLRQMFLFFTY